MGTAALAMMAPAMASAAITTSFNIVGSGTIGWVWFTPAPPGATDAASIGIAIDPTDEDREAPYVSWSGFPTTPPVPPPSFKFRSTVSSADSGGTPRLNVRFNDAGRVFMSPASWTADSWQTVDGSGNVWESSGGSCGPVAGITWAAAVACHAGANVASLSVTGRAVAPGGYAHYIDDVKFGDETISKPVGCPDELGLSENGPVSGYVSLLHRRISKLRAYDLGRLLAAANCDVVVKLGL